MNNNDQKGSSISSSGHKKHLQARLKKSSKNTLGHLQEEIKENHIISFNDISMQQINKDSESLNTIM